MNCLWTDGSSGTKSGKMGWAVVGIVDGRQVRRCGGGDGTNQRAELLAVVLAMDMVPAGGSLHVVSDSKYAIGCLEDWRLDWQGNGYVNSVGDRVANYELVLAAHSLYEERKVTFEHVRGHQGVEGNELADALCHAARLVEEGRVEVAGMLGEYLEEFR